MPRIPAGLHRDAGTGRAYGYRPVRPPAARMETYWRRSATGLHAAAQAVIPPPVMGGSPQIILTAATGPAAAGEIWSVTQVQVQTSAGHGQSPLLAQQIAAQVLGQLTTPPPPVPVQAWLSVSGVNLHLLAQSTQGSYDGLDLAGQPVRPGEAITVQWWVQPPFPGSAWFVLRGTRHTLSPV